VIAHVPAVLTTPLTLDEVRRIWPALIKKVGVRIGVPLSQAENFLAISGPNSLAVRLPTGYNGTALECDTPEALAKIEEVLEGLLHRSLVLRFENSRVEGESQPSTAPPVEQKREMFQGDPMVKKVVELFEARFLHSEPDDVASR
jgi:hypothetical protein